MLTRARARGVISVSSLAVFLYNVIDDIDDARLSDNRDAPRLRLFTRVFYQRNVVLVRFREFLLVVSENSGVALLNAIMINATCRERVFLLAVLLSELGSDREDCSFLYRSCNGGIWNLFK